MSTSTTATTGGTGSVVETKPTNSKVDLGLLEEDDEFEEFPAESWSNKNEDEEEEVKVWEDNWDDDNIEDDFSVQLRGELEKQGFMGKDTNTATK